MENKADLTHRGNGYVLLAALLWSTGGLLIKAIPWNGFATNCIRSLIAFAFFMFVRGKKSFHINKSVLMAAASMAAVTTLFVLANKLTTSANAIVLQYLSPVYVLLMTCLTEKKNPTVRQLLIVAVTFSGMVLFFMDQLDGGHIVGNILAILCGIAYASLIYFNSRPDADAEDANTLGFLLAFLLCLPMCILSKPEVSSISLGTVFLLGVFQIGLPHLIFGKALQLTSPVSASLISTLEAVFNPIWVFIAFGERPGKYALIGGIIILCGIAANILWGSEKTKNNKK